MRPQEKSRSLSGPRLLLRLLLSHHISLFWKCRDILYTNIGDVGYEEAEEARLVHFLQESRNMFAKDLSSVVDASLRIEKEGINAKNSKGQTRLHLAVLEGDGEKIEKLLKKGASHASTDANGLTPLHYGALHSHRTSEHIEKLIEGGARLEKRDGYGRTALSLLMVGVRREVFEYIVERVEKENDKEKEKKKKDKEKEKEKEKGWTTLHFLCSHPSSAVFPDRNVDNDGDDDNSSIEDGNEGDERDRLGSAEKVWKVVKREDISKVDSHLRTPLHIASSSGNLDMVKWLVLIGGAHVEAKDENGWTPLANSIGNSHLSISRWLLRSAHSDATTSGLKGTTCLHLAAALGLEEETKLLILFNAPLNAKDLHGFTPLHCAAAQGFLNIFSILVQAGADPHLPNERGITPSQLLPKSFFQTWCSIS